MRAMVTHVVIKKIDGSWAVYGVTEAGRPVPPFFKLHSLREAMRLVRRIQKEMKRPRARTAIQRRARWR